jgi:hypothetical protein
MIGVPTIQLLDGSTRVTFPLHTPDGQFDLYYLISGAPVAVDLTAPVAATLLPAMRKGWSIETAAPVSARVLAALPTIQEIIHSWDDRHTPIAVRAAAHASGPHDGDSGDVAVFFSGGVDSFYTLLKHSKQISHLIFIIGFDVPLSDHALRSKVLGALEQAAQRLGLPLIKVETNLRHFADRYDYWELYHGAALASVALMLSATLSSIYVPASDTYADLYPWGSHPLLDPLWSTESLSIIHDGCEATRLTKTARLATSTVALETLRVCWRNPGSAYNCGRCEKCLRTMVALAAVEALDRCKTFETPLDLRRVASLRLGDDKTTLMYWKQSLAAVRQRGTNRALERALHSAMRRPSLLRRLTRRARSLVRKYVGRG